jgi:outer membrane protein, heavy metal efflux system
MKQLPCLVSLTRSADAHGGAPPATPARGRSRPRSRGRRTLITFIHILLLTLALGAAETPRPVASLSLDQALVLAGERHPRLAVARARVEAAGGRVEQSGLWPAPEIIGRIEGAPLRGRTAAEAEYLAGVAQRVPLGGRPEKERELAGQNLRVAEQAWRVEAQDVRRRVHGTFATALYLEHARTVRQQLADIADRSLRIAEARVQHGDAVADEVTRTGMELARARLELEHVTRLHAQAREALAGAIGQPGLHIGGVAGELEPVWDVPALEAVLAAIETQPAVTLADAELAASQAAVALARAERIPDVNLELLYRRVEGSQQNALDLGFSMSLPLGRRLEGRRKEVEAGAAAAAAAAQATRVDVESRLREGRAALAAALARARVQRSEFTERSAALLATAETRHRAGDISLVEVLPARRDHVSLRLDYLESLRDALAAWGELATALMETRGPSLE